MAAVLSSVLCIPQWKSGIIKGGWEIKSFKINSEPDYAKVVEIIHKRMLNAKVYSLWFILLINALELKGPSIVVKGQNIPQL